MNFNLKSPCADCPFRRDSLHGWLGEDRAREIIRDTVLSDAPFFCHKTTGAGQWSEDGDQYQASGAEQVCAGMLHLEHKCNAGGNFSVRLARMFKGFRYEDLKNADLVFDTTNQFIRHHAGK